MSAEKALEGYETETRELLEGTKEINKLTDEGSLFFPPGIYLSSTQSKHKKFSGQTLRWQKKNRRHFGHAIMPMDRSNSNVKQIN